MLSCIIYSHVLTLFDYSCLHNCCSNVPTPLRIPIWYSPSLSLSLSHIHRLSLSLTLIGIVFNDLDESDGTLEYTLRLRHEVGEDDTWETRDAAPNFQLAGPRVTNKSDSLSLSLSHTHTHTHTTLLPIPLTQFLPQRRICSSGEHSWRGNHSPHGQPQHVRLRGTS